ncbi:hypothetical protein B0H63DRAFT_471312 [Podospora didyma]|uniref:Uncharacterized protein n=1 Tax=Podospora didyma TaxID=330526 RepID=A0AAE0NUL9_9PEZI|nr:hypothetical protein B0H63DRAFT_471312 [Podospora didyma]
MSLPQAQASHEQANENTAPPNTVRPPAKRHRRADPDSAGRNVQRHKYKPRAKKTKKEAMQSLATDSSTNASIHCAFGDQNAAPVADKGEPPEVSPPSSHTNAVVDTIEAAAQAPPSSAAPPLPPPQVFEGGVRVSRQLVNISTLVSATVALPPSIVGDPVVPATQTANTATVTPVSSVNPLSLLPSATPVSIPPLAASSPSATPAPVPPLAYPPSVGAACPGAACPVGNGGGGGVRQPSHWVEYSNEEFLQYMVATNRWSVSTVTTAASIGFGDEHQADGLPHVGSLEEMGGGGGGVPLFGQYDEMSLFFEELTPDEMAAMEQDDVFRDMGL